MSKEIICIDIDGVIAGIGLTFLTGYEYCPEMLGAKKAIDKIRKKYLVYLHTGRHIDHAMATIAWLKEHKIKYDHIQFGKPFAKVYIDDKGMRFESWKQIMTELKI